MANGSLSTVLHRGMISNDVGPLIDVANSTARAEGFVFDSSGLLTVTSESVWYDGPDIVMFAK